MTGTVSRRLTEWAILVEQEEAPPRNRTVCRGCKRKSGEVEGVAGEVEGEAEDEAGADGGVAWRLHRRRRDE